MNLHFIAIGGAAMHNLAIALHNKGHKVSGSDDEIFEPSKSRLKAVGLLPERIGWNEDIIHTGLDAIILGMHAKQDNPELLRAKELNLPIYSFPEYLYEQSKDKLRVVIGGSHGKTTITAMILHVCRLCGIDCDFMVGAKLEGFDVMVKITDEAPLMIIEGDEYLTSPIDLRPKFHLYHPNIALISGIAWDHFNVFKTFENYIWQFQEFVRLIEEDGHLIYYSLDKEVVNVADRAASRIKKIPYSIPEHRIFNGKTYLSIENQESEIQVFGEHNLANISAAWQVCNLLGIESSSFLKSIASYKGASNRLELIFSNENINLYRDFAHSPSKLKATTQAVKNQFPERILIACMELHTFSSLNAEFLTQYDGCMDSADVPIVYFNPHALLLKRLPMLDEDQVKKAFNNDKIHVFKDSELLQEFLINNTSTSSFNLLLMSSGDFNGINIQKLIDKLKNI